MMPPPFTISLPEGRWAIGVSGGADSVALARLAAGRGGVVIAHLNHQLRGEESEEDAAFVAALGRQLDLRVEVSLRRRWSSPPPLEGGGWGEGFTGATADQVARSAEGACGPLPLPPPSRGGKKNASASYRDARFRFFADVIARHQLDGVLLAHHADDQAETVAQRLIRGSSLPFLGGIRSSQRIKGLRVERPLLNLRREQLRDYLRSIGQPWREDSSNASPKYRRNVIRQALAADPQLTPQLLRLADVSDGFRRLLEARSPVLAEVFSTQQLKLARPYAEFAARRWLVARGAPPDRVSPAVCRRLVDQAIDVTQPSRQHYPGGLLVRRRAGVVDVMARTAVQSAQSHGQETPTTPEL